jgi:hypothetical protein
MLEPEFFIDLSGYGDDQYREKEPRKHVAEKSKEAHPPVARIAKT